MNRVAIRSLDFDSSIYALSIGYFGVSSLSKRILYAFICYAYLKKKRYSLKSYLSEKTI